MADYVQNNKQVPNVVLFLQLQNPTYPMYLRIRHMFIKTPLNLCLSVTSRGRVALFLHLTIYQLIQN